ncbi:hypothetical protein [Streptomyces aureus]|uniref:hypothetical protein n=1 Tax=Streptomyces aureus TaxID=193461 RepID=UPI00131AE4FC|nr:hypothetical protein [Streptomyces aureus]
MTNVFRHPTGVSDAPWTRPYAIAVSATLTGSASAAHENRTSQLRPLVPPVPPQSVPV